MNTAVVNSAFAIQLHHLVSNIIKLSSMASLNLSLESPLTMTLQPVLVSAPLRYELLNIVTSSISQWTNIGLSNIGLSNIGMHVKGTSASGATFGDTMMQSSLGCPAAQARSVMSYAGLALRAPPLCPSKGTLGKRAYSTKNDPLSGF